MGARPQEHDTAHQGLVKALGKNSHVAYDLDLACFKSLNGTPAFAVRGFAGDHGRGYAFARECRGYVFGMGDGRAEHNGFPVAGLFAVGNDAASIFGGHYPSGGITLGPGMTFGYIAARVLAGLPVTGAEAPQARDLETTP